MPEPDYYQTLGVSRSASAEEIKKAYRKLSRENHPDAKPDDAAAAERFKQVQEAWDVLGDEEKRKNYDHFGTAYPGGRPGGPSQTGWRPGGEVPIDLGDLFGGAGGFEDLFSGRTRSRASRRGRDQRAEVHIPFVTAASGGNVDVRVSQGSHIETLAVRIPAGVDDGSVIRLAGQGDPSPRGGQPGDLLLKIHVDPHPYFRREGADIVLDTPITPAEAVLGAKIEVPTLKDGHVVLTVPPGTSSGMKLRLRGKGIEAMGSGQPGDQFVVIRIVVPREPGEAMKSVYRQVAATEANPRTGHW